MRRLRWPAGPPWWLCVVVQGASKDLLAMVGRELVRLPGADRDSAVHRKVGSPARVKGHPTSSDVGSQLARPACARLDRERPAGRLGFGPPLLRRWQPKRGLHQPGEVARS